MQFGKGTNGQHREEYSAFPTMSFLSSSRNGGKNSSRMDGQRRGLVPTPQLLLQVLAHPLDYG